MSRGKDCNYISTNNTKDILVSGVCLFPLELLPRFTPLLVSSSFSVRNLCRPHKHPSSFFFRSMRLCPLPNLPRILLLPALSVSAGGS